MSRPQDLHRPFLPFGNPFRMILSKSSYLSPKLLALLNNFEENLAERLRKLEPNSKEDVLSLSWMGFAMKSLCETHADIKTLITSLELPVYDWDDKWISVYLDNSVKLLDICIAFISEISRLNQGHLFLKCKIACSSLDAWKQHINSKNPRLENCFSILDNLTQTLNTPKVKNSAKGKVLMRAMFGVKVQTVFICSIFAAIFSGSVKKLVDLEIPESCAWGEAVVDLQSCVNGEIRTWVIVLKELEDVDSAVKKLYPMVQAGEAFGDYVTDLERKADKLSKELDVLAKEVDGFFHVVMTGRDALISNLRVGNNASVPIQAKNKVHEQAVR